jgi:methionyl-tRNA formyltransferase
MGTPDFAAVALKAIHAAGHEIARAYSQPPRPADRGMKERKSAVHKLAEALGIPVRTPLNLKGAEAEEFAALGADAAVVAAYGLLLPKAVLDAPRLGCFNIHASLLPRWRGAAPIQRAIMAGDAETGVTIMQMEEGLDTGPMLLKARVPIGPETTAGALHDRLAEIGGRLIVDALEKLEAGTFHGEPQPAEGVTYAKKISKAEAKIDFARGAAEVRNHIHGLSPFPGAWLMLEGARIKVLTAAVEPGAGAPGSALDDRLLFACRDGAIRMLTVQREGKEPMEADPFLRGMPVPKGARAG